jgi:hypothetical protein
VVTEFDLVCRIKIAQRTVEVSAGTQHLESLFQGIRSKRRIGEDGKRADCARDQACADRTGAVDDAEGEYEGCGRLAARSAVAGLPV